MRPKFNIGDRPGNNINQKAKNMAWELRISHKRIITMSDTVDVQNDHLKYLRELNKQLKYQIHCLKIKK